MIGIGGIGLVILSIAWLLTRPPAGRSFSR
jgi:hypothetical protein